MRHQLCFLVRAKSSLKDALARLPADVLEIFEEPCLMSQDFADRSAWSPESYALVAKLTYLGWLGTLDGGGFEALFGSSTSVGSEDFDRYWALETYLDFDSLDTMGAHLEQTQHPPLRRTGNPFVDAWLERHRLL